MARAKPSFEEIYGKKVLSGFYREFKKESDRASAIIASAMLDEALKTLLKKFLVSSPNKRDRLFDGAGPISTFSSRIDFAYRLSLISRRLCRDLHIVRDIRNDFAHNIGHCSFQNTAVSNRVSELIKSFIFLEIESEFRKIFPAGNRGDFQYIVHWELAHLCDLAKKVVPMKRAELEFVYDRNHAIVKNFVKSKEILKVMAQHKE